MKNWKWHCKTKLYKWIHAEFWPMWLYYVPLIPLWLYYLIRTRRIKLYRYINPGIHNGGLFDVSKWDIYQALPPAKIPKTAMVSKELNGTNFLEKQAFHYPFIVKPDKGYRGKGVLKITNETEWNQYYAALTEPALIQEYVDAPTEVGIFYIRNPLNEKGTIIGITLKHFMIIKGDGHHTIETLLAQNPRYALQINRLSKYLNINRILPPGEELLVEPIGNHNRGTLFEDGNACIAPPLVDQIDALAKTIPGFYYGRFDIKCHSLEDVINTQSFKIIELNGALSEPTHMYDPKTGYWKAIRILWDCHRKMLEIACINLELAKKSKN